MKRTTEEIDQEREEAWIGDAILALYMREWLLREKGKIDGEAFIRATSNDFLRVKGNPTAVEAEIGREYQERASKLVSITLSRSLFLFLFSAKK